MSDPTEPPHASRDSVVIKGKENRRWFRFLALLGVTVILIELAVSYITGEKMNGMRLLVGSIIGFVGFYGLDSKELREAGTLVYNWTSGILTIVRTGKRADDAPGTVVVTEVATKADPPTVTTTEIDPTMTGAPTREEKP